MHPLLEAILLGVVQGLTEFIPVSSSGHLVLVPHLLGLGPRGLAFDVGLHMGTLFAVLAYFRAELAVMARGLLGRDRSRDGLVYRRLGLLVVAGSVPVAVVGFVLKDSFERVFATPVAAGCLLFVTAALLLTAERFRDRRVAASQRPAPAGGSTDHRHVDALPMGADPRDPCGVTLDRVGLREALLIGTGQCIALLPGVSRSGATIAAGMASGLTREAATRFSFLLSLPALVGAGLLSAPDLAESGRAFSTGELAVGVLSAFVSGYAAIRFLVALVARARLTGFAVYCVIAGVVALTGLALLG